MVLLYHLFLFLYNTGIRIAALFLPKAALWIKGRKSLLPHIKSILPHNEKRIWMHCASLGEFEQGRPVLEAYRKQYPDHKILLTFFSPSGYEVCKDYEGADYVFYLPMDSRKHARDFLHAVDPELIIFVKYEFWYFYLTEAKKRNIPSILISAAFRKEQAFFKWYGGFFRHMLKSFSYLLVQDNLSKELLEGIGIRENVAVTGDTRYDRVDAIARNARSIPEIEAFRQLHLLIIAGSTWPADEQALKAALPSVPENWKIVIAPHEIDAAHIKQVQELFGTDAILFSQWKEAPQRDKKVLIVNNIGMLSSLYRYGALAFVGGGFNKSGIHNVLEPAVFGLPVLIGPVYKKFVEAVALVQEGLVIVSPDEAAFQRELATLIGNAAKRKQINEELQLFMAQHTGATERIMKLIEKVLNPD